MPPKPAPNDWKTGYQLEFLFGYWPAFKAAQDARTLDTFWKRVFEEWFHEWPVQATVDEIREYGPMDAAIMHQKEKKTKIKQWFHNHGRSGSDSAKGSRGELKLDVGEKRKLAAVQAYCSYSWTTTLRDIVITRWQQDRCTRTFEDDEDPQGDGNTMEECIPLAYKLEIAKEVYKSLSAEEKKEIDRRREEDRKKMYRKVCDIDDEEERLEKLQNHLKNQPLVAKSLLRVLLNLEDQAGCVSQLLVASVNPETGKPVIQKFCQGETASGGLNFEAYYGEGWNENVEKKFGEWALRIFGDKGTARRGLFMLEKADDQPEAPPPEPQTIEAPQPPNPAPAPKKSVSRPSKSKKMALKPSQPPATIHGGSGTVGTIQLAASTPRLTNAPDVAIESHSQVVAQPSQVVAQPSQVVAQPSQVVAQPSQVVSRSSQVVAQPSGGVSQPSQVIIEPISQVAIGPSQVITKPRQIAVQPQAVVQPPPVVTQPPPQAVVQLTPPVVAQSPPLVVAQPPPPAVAQPPPPVVAQPPPPVVAQPPPQVVVQPLPAILPPQINIQQSPQVAVRSPELAVQPSQPLTGVNSTPNSQAPRVQYRVRPTVTDSGRSSRRDSIDGAPEMVVDLVDEEGDVVVDLSEYIVLDSDDESHVSSSQKTADESFELVARPSELEKSNTSIKGTAKDDESRSDRTLPQLDADQDTLGDWLPKKDRWEYITSTAGGAAWEDLLKAYIEQERRLEFAEVGANFSTENRPPKISEYFQYAHQPNRGNNLVLPEIGAQVAAWWGSIQPGWRRANQDPPPTSSAWSFILSGGPKGAFLLILCLAWWDRAHERYLKGQKEAGVSNGIPDHDADWLRVVNDVAFVMRKARDSDIPVKATKRKREVDSSAARKNVRKRA